MQKREFEVALQRTLQKTGLQAMEPYLRIPRAVGHLLPAVSLVNSNDQKVCGFTLTLREGAFYSEGTQLTVPGSQTTASLSKYERRAHVSLELALERVLSALYATAYEQAFAEMQFALSQQGVNEVEDLVHSEYCWLNPAAARGSLTEMPEWQRFCKRPVCLPKWYGLFEDWCYSQRDGEHQFLLWLPATRNHPAWGASVKKVGSVYRVTSAYYPVSEEERQKTRGLRPTGASFSCASLYFALDDAQQRGMRVWAQQTDSEQLRDAVNWLLDYAQA